MKQRMNERTNERTNERNFYGTPRSSVFYVARQKIRLDVALSTFPPFLPLFLSLFFWVVGVIGEKSSRVITVRARLYDISFISFIYSFIHLFVRSFLPSFFFFFCLSNIRTIEKIRH